jgi:hypothetical protein
VSCTDYERHELLLDCTHERVAGVMVQVAMDDGCSGRLCPICVSYLDVVHWPGLSEIIARPERGLDALQMLRALRAPPGAGFGVRRDERSSGALPWAASSAEIVMAAYW